MQIAKRNIQCNLGPTKMVTMLKVGLSFEWLYIRIGIIVVQVSFDLFVAQTLFDIFILTLKHFLLVRQIIPLRVALWLCQKLPKYGEASRAYDRSYQSYTLHVPTTTYNPLYVFFCKVSQFSRNEHRLEAKKHRLRNQTVTGSEAKVGVWPRGRGLLLPHLLLPPHPRVKLPRKNALCARQGELRTGKVRKQKFRSV